MSAEIHEVRERRRGCGFRRPGFYLRSLGLGRDCGKLPIPLDVCPTCHGGIKPSRGWTWVNGAELVKDRICVTDANGNHCAGCVLATKSTGLVRVGLLWIGEKYYTPQSWLAECHEMGVSRRLPGIPKGFKIGETWVFAAHRKAVAHVEFGKNTTYAPGIFHIFKPTEIEYVVGKKEGKKKLAKLVERGIKLVKVIPVEEKDEPLL